VARAKKTDRAEARRRYRAETAPADVGATDEGDAPASTARATRAATPAYATPAGRVGIGTAFRTAFHPVNIREDLAALPWLLRSRAFLLPNVVLFTMTTAGFSFQFLTALYLQDTLRLDALHTGLAYLPVTLAIAVTSLGLSGRLASRFGPARVLVVGLLLFVVGMLMMAALPDHGAYAVHVAPGFVVMGAGFGLAMPQVTALAMAAAPGDHAGAASGFVGTTQQVGGAVGLAVVALVAVHLGRAGGFLVAAAALAVGTAVAGYLATGTATRATSSRANVR